MSEQKRFPSPYDLGCPPGADGWNRLYPYYVVFQENLRKEEENRFWFCDAQHWPTVIRPFDAIAPEFVYKCVSQYNTRHYMLPPANGLDCRIFNGYLFVSAVAVPADQIAARIPQFLERAGHYYQNWNALLENLDKKIRKIIAELDALTFESFPDTVPLEWILEGHGLDNTTSLTENHDRAIQLCYRAWQLHFELLNLGYAAYLDFFGFCKEQFQNIPDQAIARMVQGIEVDLFRPDEEVQKLARLAVDLGVADALSTGSMDEALAAVERRPNGARWLAAWKAAQQPWFNFTSGNGFYSADKYWIDHLDIPLGYLRDYIVRVKNGETIERPTAAIAAERDRITSEYAAMLSSELRPIWDQKLGLARTVFPHVENHNFFIEHWFMGVFWRKMHALSKLLMKAGFWNEPEDLFYLTCSI